MFNAYCVRDNKKQDFIGEVELAVLPRIGDRIHLTDISYEQWEVSSFIHYVSKHEHSIRLYLKGEVTK